MGFIQLLLPPVEPAAGRRNFDLLGSILGFNPRFDRTFKFYYDFRLFSLILIPFSQKIQDELLREDPFTSVLTLQTRLRNLLRTSVVRCSENIYFCGR